MRRQIGPTQRRLRCQWMVVGTIRIALHDKDEKKEFWTRCVAVISKDLNLTKAHLRYLESRLISMGYAAVDSTGCDLAAVRPAIA